ncbi:MAG: nickel-dependent lactate racemase [archaeon]
MVEMWLPYGKTEVAVRIPDENVGDVIQPIVDLKVPDAESELRRALDDPIGTSKLSSLASSSDTVAIVVDDATRRAPNPPMLKAIMAELNVAGVKEENVTVIVGVGIHRPATVEELSPLSESFGKVRVISHDYAASDLVRIGKTTRGTPVDLNKAFADADLKILTGDVELHYFAGYGGGRKSILPAITGEESTQKNHALLLDPQARTGVLKGNPVSEDMNEGAKLANPDFILNVVLDSNGAILKAFAGDLEKAFLEGVALVDKMCKVPIDSKADVVIVSAGGAPRDLNLYQAHKALHNSLSALKDEGVVILVADCPDGHGNKTFYEWMTRFKDAQEMEDEIKKKFRLGGHKAYYLAKTLEKAKVYLVSTMPDSYVSNVFKMRPSRTVNAALQSAFRVAGKASKVAVMPFGSVTLPVSG